MTLRKRILVNGLLAAVPLALVGYLFSHLAGMYTAAQDSRADTAANSAAVTETLVGRLPYTLAIGGFLFVAFGECLLAMWRRPATK